MRPKMSVVEGEMYEGIITTFVSRPNAAAIGYKYIKDIIHIRCFFPSNTYSNLLMVNKFALNVMGREDCALLIRAALVGEGNNEMEFEREEYESVDGVFFLKKAKEVLICEVVEKESTPYKDEIGEAIVLDVRAAVVNRITRGKVIPVKRIDAPILNIAVRLTKARAAHGKHRHALLQNIEKEVKNVEDEEMRALFYKYLSDVLKRK